MVSSLVGRGQLGKEQVRCPCRRLGGMVIHNFHDGAILEWIPDQTVSPLANG